MTTKIPAAGLGCMLLLAPLAVDAASSSLHEAIGAAAAAQRDELVALRRDLHRHPELSGQEERTAGEVAKRLEALGLEVRTGVGGHGVVGLLRGAGDGPVVAYRADMDAVTAPVVSTQEYRSTVDGVAHVCGHDAHTTIGVGVASVLAALRERWNGSVKFLFQPSEENLQGAEDMLRDGAFRSPKPEAIFAVHTSPFPVGVLGCAPGHGLPGLQPFSVTFRGVEDPAAVSERVISIIEGVSTVQPPASVEEFARFIAALRTEGGGFLSSFAYAGARAVEAEAGDQGRIDGFLRTVGGPATGAAFAIRQQLFGLPEGARWEMTFGEPFPAMVNDEELTDAACDTLRQVLGDDAVQMVYASHPFNGEDFALFQERVPGSMFWLGVASPEKGLHGIPHLPDFDIDEEALVVGTRAMASVLVEYLLRHDDGP